MYVIFIIAPFDLFGQEKYMYTFRMTCDEVPGLELKDGGVRIFLNTHGRNDDEVSSELSEFLYFVEHPSKDNGDFQNPRVQKLADQIENIKRNHLILSLVKLEKVIELSEYLQILRFRNFGCLLTLKD